jgi:predicted small secreted protein
VKLFDLTGKLLKSINTSSNAGEDVQLDATALEKGIYLVQLLNKSGVIFSTLVTIQ